MMHPTDEKHPETPRAAGSAQPDHPTSDPDRDVAARAEKDRMLDEALADTFPASDPVAISP
jgi:hypothetical protein